VIGAFGLLEIRFMAIYAGLSQRTVLQFRSRFVALVAIDGFMYPHKRERGFIVNFRNVFNDPRLRVVTTCAVVSYGLVMHVAVATDTGRACFFEIQIRMTSLAFDIFMLSF
jgi:hypothetical protein